MSVTELEPADRIGTGPVGSGVVGCGWFYLECDVGRPNRAPGFRPSPEYLCLIVKGFQVAGA